MTTASGLLTAHMDNFQVRKPMNDGVFKGVGGLEVKHVLSVDDM